MQRLFTCYATERNLSQSTVSTGLISSKDPQPTEKLLQQWRSQEYVTAGVTKVFKTIAL